MTGDIHKLDQLVNMLSIIATILGIIAAIAFVYLSIWCLILLYKLAKICVAKIRDFLIELQIKKEQVSEEILATDSITENIRLAWRALRISKPRQSP